MISTDQIRQVFDKMPPPPAPLTQDDPARKCHSPECWCCHGTGVSQRPDIPGVCEMNDKIPF